jgi:hypothetical protein
LLCFVSHPINQEESVKTKHIFAVALATSTLTLAACGSDTKVGREVARNTMKIEVRQGPWWTACQESSVVGNPFNLPRVRREIELGDSLQKITTFYGASATADGCGGTPAISIIENGNYEVGSVIRGTTYEFNESYLSVAITPVTDEGKQALIATNACGTTDWVVGVQKIVTGDTANPGCWTKTPRAAYDIIEKYQTGIQFGEPDQNHDASAADRRPLVLSNTLRFDKK